jgi:putative chitinase
MKLTLAMLTKMVGSPTAAQQANMKSVLLGLDQMGDALGVNTAQRLAQYLAQLMHESGGFVFDREAWGPTPAQKGYEGRKDLGNVEAGDGSKFRGHGPIQITGRANTEDFRDWCRAQGLPAPDFEERPELINTDPWEGIGPLWYWSTRNLNRYADEGNIEMLTKRINGGLNGYDDRIGRYVRVSLIMLGNEMKAGVLERFQTDQGLTPDDDPGPATRKALHLALGKLADAPVTASAPALVVVVTPAPASAVPVIVAPPIEAPIGTFDQYLAIIEASTAAIRQIRAGQE